MRCGPILHCCILCSPAGSQRVAVLRVCERLKYRLPDVTDHMHNVRCRQHLQLLNSSTVCAVSGAHGRGHTSNADAAQKGAPCWQRPAWRASCCRCDDPQLLSPYRLLEGPARCPAACTLTHCLPVLRLWPGPVHPACSALVVSRCTRARDPCVGGWLALRPLLETEQHAC